MQLLAQPCRWILLGLVFVLLPDASLADFIPRPQRSYPRTPRAPIDEIPSVVSTEQVSSPDGHKHYVLPTSISVSTFDGDNGILQNVPPALSRIENQPTQSALETGLGKYARSPIDGAALPAQGDGSGTGGFSQPALPPVRIPSSMTLVLPNASQAAPFSMLPSIDPQTRDKDDISHGVPISVTGSNAAARSIYPTKAPSGATFSSSLSPDKRSVRENHRLAGLAKRIERDVRPTSLYCTPKCEICRNETPPLESEPFNSEGKVPDRPRDKPLLTPEDYSSFAEFFEDQRAGATVVPKSAPESAGIRQSASVLALPLANQKFNAVISNLCGCTSILVASRKHIWWTHLWQSDYLPLGFSREYDYDDFGPSFRPIDFIDGNTQQAVHAYNLKWYQDLGVFAPETNPYVLIFTPENPDVPGSPTHRFALEKIKDRIKQSLINPTIKIEYVLYQNTDDLEKGSGHALFQYEPRHSITNCVIYAAMRVYLWGNDPRPVKADLWAGTSEQSGGNFPQIQKRDDEGLQIPSSCLAEDTSKTDTAKTDGPTTTTITSVKSDYSTSDEKPAAKPTPPPPPPPPMPGNPFGVECFIDRSDIEYDTWWTRDTNGDDTIFDGGQIISAIQEACVLKRLPFDDDEDTGIIHWQVPKQIPENCVYKAFNGLPKDRARLKTCTEKKKPPRMRGD